MPVIEEMRSITEMALKDSLSFDKSILRWQYVDRTFI